MLVTERGIRYYGKVGPVRDFKRSRQTHQRYRFVIRAAVAGDKPFVTEEYVKCSDGFWRVYYKERCDDYLDAVLSFMNMRAWRKHQLNRMESFHHVAAALGTF